MALPKLDVPRYETTLPSTNKKLIYRPYLVKEEKVLMIAMESSDQTQMIRAIKDIITSCTEGTVDADDMTMFDLEYMFAQLRAKSVGETSKVVLPCQSCEEKNEVNIDLSKAVVDVPNEKSKKIKLTKDVSIILKYPSVSDIEKVQSSGKKEIDVIFDLIAASIDSIYYNEEIFDAKDQSKKELNDFIESLSSEQFNKIKEFIENFPTVKLTASFDCQSCNAHNDIELKGLNNFFA